MKSKMVNICVHCSTLYLYQKINTVAFFYLSFLSQTHEVKSIDWIYVLNQNGFLESVIFSHYLLSNIRMKYGNSNQTRWHFIRRWKPMRSVFSIRLAMKLLMENCIYLMSKEKFFETQPHQKAVLLSGMPTFGSFIITSQEIW